MLTHTHTCIHTNSHINVHTHSHAGHTGPKGDPGQRGDDGRDGSPGDTGPKGMHNESSVLCVRNFIIHERFLSCVFLRCPDTTAGYCVSQNTQFCVADYFHQPTNHLYNHSFRNLKITGPRVQIDLHCLVTHPLY